MLLVQKFLETKTFEELRLEHGVEPSFDKLGTKFSLNYSQIESREDDVLAQQCRGLILKLDPCKAIQPSIQGATGRAIINYDKVCPGKTAILAYPMNRFFNHGQGFAASIDWNSSKILEKLDGTLCIVYYDDIIYEWCVATRSTPNADIPLDFPVYTFRTLFEKALTETTGFSFDQFSSKLNKRRTYCFELTTPYNRIVVKYTVCRIHLLAVRDLDSLKELDTSETDECELVPRVKSYDLASLQHTIEYVNNQSPADHEGVVAKSNALTGFNFDRIKIKNASYVIYNRARDVLGASYRNCLSLILAGKEDDMISFMPEEIAKVLLDMKQKFAVLIKKYDIIFKGVLSATKEYNLSELSPAERKVFAGIVQEQKLWPSPFFEMYSGKAKSFKDFIDKKAVDGQWTNSILDQILKEMEYDNTR